MAILIVLAVAVFLVLFIILLPILFSIRAVGSLFVYPGQLRTMFGNRILRRNHALEHATIAVMMEREPGRRFSGFSTDDGFFVQGVKSLDEVDSAAREAVGRLKDGEKNSGVIAAPLFVMGAAAGAIVTASQVGSDELAASTARIAESLGAPELQLTPDEAWNFFLLGTALSAVVQAGLLIGVSVATAAWISRKK